MPVYYLKKTTDWQTRTIFNLELNRISPTGLRQLISSPPVLKAYNYRMGGVDRHDRLVGQHSIPLTTKRGYMKVFYHLLDSAVVNAWILYKTAKQEKSEWNMAAKERHNLAWFKESVILSLCSDYTTRKRTYGSMPQTTTPQVGHSLKAISKHQIQPIANIPEYQDKPKMGRCCVCSQPKRTACIACLKVYCYECGRQHLEQLMSQSSGQSLHYLSSLVLLLLPLLVLVQIQSRPHMRVTATVKRTTFEFILYYLDCVIIDVQ